jgi:hypothetical protein
MLWPLPPKRLLYEDIVKVAIAFSVPITTADGYGWRWRSEDYTRECTELFVFYADCVADAERHGYTIKLCPA